MSYEDNYMTDDNGVRWVKLELCNKHIERLEQEEKTLRSSLSEAERKLEMYRGLYDRLYKAADSVFNHVEVLSRTDDDALWDALYTTLDGQPTIPPQTGGKNS